MRSALFKAIIGISNFLILGNIYTESVTITSGLTSFIILIKFSEFFFIVLIIFGIFNIVFLISSFWLEDP